MDSNNQPIVNNSQPMGSVNNSVNMPPTNLPTSAPSPEHKKVGPIIAILVIVLILVIAALYLFASKINQQQLPADNTTAINQESSDIAAASVQAVVPVTNTSDDIQSLQNDLDVSTNGVDGQGF